MINVQSDQSHVLLYITVSLANLMREVSYWLVLYCCSLPVLAGGLLHGP